MFEGVGRIPSPITIKPACKVIVEFIMRPYFLIYASKLISYKIIDDDKISSSTAMASFSSKLWQALWDTGR